MSYFPAKGDIVKLSLNPTKGHEQKGFRPVMIVSNQMYNELAGSMVLVCPITNTDKEFPMHVPLKDGMVTTGVVLCEHIRAIDIKARFVEYVEQAPSEIVNEALDIIFGSIE